jgi:hypothetical protein
METNVLYPTKEEIDMLLSELETNALPLSVASLFAKVNTRLDCLDAGKKALRYLYDNDEKLTDENVSGTFAFIVLKTLRVWQNEKYNVIVPDWAKADITEEYLKVLIFRELRSYILNIEQHNFIQDKAWKEKYSKTVINFFIKSGLDLENIYNNPLNCLQFKYRC